MPASRNQTTRTSANEGDGPSATVDAYLAGLPTWQSALLADFRAAIARVEPAVTEGWKWNVPVFLLGSKTIFAMSAFTAHVKLNFLLNGALLDDPDGLFNNGFDSKRSRGIDVREGGSVDADALERLIGASVQAARRS